jgi:hypothetical protein
MNGIDLKQDKRTKMMTMCGRCRHCFVVLLITVVAIQPTNQQPSWSNDDPSEWDYKGNLKRNKVSTPASSISSFAADADDAFSSAADYVVDVDSTVSINALSSAADVARETSSVAFTKFSSVLVTTTVDQLRPRQSTAVNQKPIAMTTDAKFSTENNARCK